jgi:hypothetical protein
VSSWKSAFELASRSRPWTTSPEIAARPSVPDRDAVGVDASAEHGDVVELDARLGRENFADREHRAVPRIGEGAASGSREQLAVPRAYLCRAENVGRRRRRPDERDRDHECEGAHPPAR